MGTRKPAVAGSFYEGTEKALQSQVGSFVDQATPKKNALGVMAPHAGFVYSGSVAGAVYSRIGPADTFLILGPNHTGLGAEVSVYSEGAWETPLGKVHIDTELAHALLESSEDFSRDDAAHLSEHSIETQIPFLQYLFNDFKMVPVCVGRLDLQKCLRIGKSIAKTLKGGPKKVVLIASSDMSHYVSKETAERLDRLAFNALEKRDPVLLFETVRNNHISMCGVLPAICMISACNELGATTASLVKYTNSGDVTRDYRQVVSYAGIIIQ